MTSHTVHTHLYLGLADDATPHGGERRLCQLVVVVEDEGAVRGAINEHVVARAVARKLALEIALLRALQDVVNPQYVRWHAAAKAKLNRQKHT